MIIFLKKRALHGISIFCLITIIMEITIANVITVYLHNWFICKLYLFILLHAVRHTSETKTPPPKKSQLSFLEDVMK